MCEFRSKIFRHCLAFFVKVHGSRGGGGGGGGVCFAFDLRLGIHSRLVSVRRLVIALLRNRMSELLRDKVGRARRDDSKRSRALSRRVQLDQVCSVPAFLDNFEIFWRRWFGQASCLWHEVSHLSKRLAQSRVFYRPVVRLEVRKTFLEKSVIPRENELLRRKKNLVIYHR